MSLFRLDLPEQPDKATCRQPAQEVHFLRAMPCDSLFKRLSSHVLQSVLFLALALVVGATAHAQGFGIGALLDPEGSRLFPQQLTVPRHAGKPDLRWRHFDWNYTDVDAASGNYRLYFYNEEYWAAQFAQPQIAEQMNYLQGVFNYKPTKRFSYILFNSQRDFQQANVFDISEGVQGITSTTEATMAIPYWGEAETYRHISTHEMVHQFQVQKFADLSEGNSQLGMSILPLWFVEGMAEYYSLKGVDAESRFYLRDVMQNPNSDQGYKIPGFFEEGQYGFIFIYKFGQAKIDFLESHFGKGTVQRLLETAAHGPLKDEPPISGNAGGPFAELTTRVLKLPPDLLEQQWKAYLEKTYRPKLAQLSQDFGEPPNLFEVVKAAGDTLDTYAVSPNAEILAIREIDPLSGVTSIALLDRKNHDEKIQVIDSDTIGIISLYFEQSPIMALSDTAIAYFALTVSGPVLEIQKISRDSSGHLKLGKRLRNKIYHAEITQGSAPAWSPDGTQLAFVGLGTQGWQNIYTLSLEGLGDNAETAVPVKITDSYYSWRNLSWNKSGITGSSDQTSDQVYNIFLIHPESKIVERITNAPCNEYGVQGETDDLVFESWFSGASQIHRLQKQATEPPEEIRLTDVKTGLTNPTLRGGTLYAIGFRSGRFHLYQIPQKKLLALPVYVAPNLGTPWVASPVVFTSTQIKPYKPFSSSGYRIDNLGGFFASGSAGGITATASDLMRDYSITGDIFVFGQIKLTDADLFFSKQKERTKWIVGAYEFAQNRLDNLFASDGNIRTYLTHEYGALGAAKYPFGPYSYLDFELRVGAIRRTEFSDPTLSDQWQNYNPGNEFIASPVVRLGYDRLIYEPFTGPLKGYSLLAESETALFPKRKSASERTRLDGSLYIDLIRRTVLAVRGMAGASWGGRFNNPFYVSSDDILRAYSFGDNRLYGNYLLAGSAEVRFPIGSAFGFPPLRGLAGADIGSIFLNRATFSSSVTSSKSVGLMLNFPPIALNFIESYPTRVAPGPVDSSVFHFTLRYLYL